MVDNEADLNEKNDKRKHADFNPGEEGDFAEPHSALIAVHPSDVAVAIAVGDELRVYDKRDGEVHVLIPRHDSVKGFVTRGIAFSRCGRFFVSGGDDKIATLWACSDWQIIKTLKSPKKIGVVGFSGDGRVFIAGNKFGDVLVSTTAVPTDGDKACSSETLLGHYCSILTSLSVSKSGELVATTDRDSKVRVSVMPEDPMQGAHEIKSYCFGHTNFASCSAFVSGADGSETEMLLTGGGDGTVRLWNPVEGKQVCVIKVCEYDKNIDKKKHILPVLAVQPSKDCRHAVVVVDGESAIRVLALDLPGNTMNACQICTLSDLPVVTDMCMDAFGRFWFVGGPIGAEETSAIVVCASLSPEGHLELCDPQPIPVEAKVQLERCSSNRSDVQPIRVLPTYLSRKPYNPEERDKRARKMVNN